jgi:hypothetical protein
LVAHYLECGTQLGSKLGWSNDAYSPEQRTSLETLTDGEWIWPADAAYYCKTYGILPVDTDFIDLVRHRDGECPKPDADTVEYLAYNWYKPMRDGTKTSADLSGILARVAELASDARNFCDEVVALGLKAPFISRLQRHADCLTSLRDAIHDAQLIEEDAKRAQSRVEIETSSIGWNASP